LKAFGFRPHLLFFFLKEKEGKRSKKKQKEAKTLQVYRFVSVNKGLKERASPRS
jgi:hypothetical protein